MLCILVNKKAFIPCRLRYLDLLLMHLLLDSLENGLVLVVAAFGGLWATLNRPDPWRLPEKLSVGRAVFWRFSSVALYAAETGGCLQVQSSVAFSILKEIPVWPSDVGQRLSDLCQWCHDLDGL